MSPRASHASGVRSRFPSTRSWAEGPWLIFRSSLPLVTCVFATFSDLKLSVFVCRGFVAPAFHLLPYCRYRLCTCLAPSLLHLLLSLYSCRSPASASCVPVSRHLRCLLVFPGPALVDSSLALTAVQVGFRALRRASPPFSFLGKSRPCHIGALHS